MKSSAIPAQFPQTDMLRTLTLIDFEVKHEKKEIV